MRIGRYLSTERYDKKGRIVIEKGFRIGSFHCFVEKMRLSHEELQLIGLADVGVDLG